MKLSKDTDLSTHKKLIILGKRKCLITAQLFKIDIVMMSKSCCYFKKDTLKEKKYHFDFIL